MRPKLSKYQREPRRSPRLVATLGTLQRGGKFFARSYDTPFPWFGGKSWLHQSSGNASAMSRNYVEPFAGSLAVLLARLTRRAESGR